MLKSKTTLKAKTPLKAKVAIKAVSATPKKRKAPKITLLKRKAWKVFSQYVRLRDSERKGNKWYGVCITCSHNGLVAYIEDGKLKFTRGWDAGHYISRGNWFLRHDEENVNLQCSFRCNRMRSGEHEKYKLALDFKYGDGTSKKLDQLAADNPAHRPTITELEEVIHNATEAIDFYVKSL